MPNVSLNLLNRTYQMACDVGQEKRLQQLSEGLDAQLRTIAKQAAGANESYLLVMLLLLQADQLEQANNAQQQAQNSVTNAHQLKQDDITAAAILHLNDRVAQMTSQLNSWLKAA